MWKKNWPVLLSSLLLTGCTATFTNLTPQQQARSANNFYPVEVAFNSQQQSLIWGSIKPTVVVGGEALPMRQTPLMSNRWEGLVPVGPGANSVFFHYKFDFEYRDFGGPKSDSAHSPEYRLQIRD